MDLGELNIRRADNGDTQEVRDLVFGILEEYGLLPDPEGIDRDLEDIEANYLNRGGDFQVLLDEHGEIVGSVGLYPIDRDTVELRKMYFRRRIRGKGLGKKLLANTVETAARLGYKKITLETASALKEAIGLYKSFGFLPVEGVHADRCDQSFYLELGEG